MSLILFCSAFVYLAVKIYGDRLKQLAAASNVVVDNDDDIVYLHSTMEDKRQNIETVDIQRGIGIERRTTISKFAEWPYMT